jgi:hypothetical protein
MQSGAVHSGELVVTVKGKSLPEMKRLSLTFNYDPSEVDLLESLVTTPIPSTAFGAHIDTATHTLGITIVATSTFTVGEGAEVSIIRVPSSGGTPSDAVRLNDALCIDINDTEVAVSIDEVGVIVSPAIRSAPGYSREVSVPGKMLALDGRSCARGAAGVYVHTTGRAVFFSGRRVAAEIVERD